MTEDPSLTESVSQKLKTRSMGVKLILICGLALLMTIPSFFVSELITERTQREGDVVREISNHLGGQQSFLGPTLLVPYSIPPRNKDAQPTNGTYLVFPSQASALVKTTTEERRRSLFRVPVFRADMKLDADFDLNGIPGAAPDGAIFDWKHAEIVVGASDARGAMADASLTANGKTLVLAPATLSEDMAIDSNPTNPMRLRLFGAFADNFGIQNRQFHVSASMSFSGAQRLAILAYGKTTRVKMASDWSSPSFDGGFLPVKRSISDKGFQAEWSVPFIARGVRAEGIASSITRLDAASLGVSFVELADPYQSVNRALKYLLLFLGFVFLSYFIFETTTRKRVHPAQYLLVGVAQIIFYLLLLSLAERIGFDYGFLIAGAATVALLSANTAWIFGNRSQGYRALGIFSVLYTFIYLLLRMEDNALLLGAIASFMAIAATMYFTRNIDWYSSLPGTTNTNE